MSNEETEAMGRSEAKRLGIVIKHYPAFRNNAGEQPEFWAFYDSPGWMNSFMDASIRHGSYGSIARLHLEIGRAVHQCRIACGYDTLTAERDGLKESSLNWEMRYAREVELCRSVKEDAERAEAEVERLTLLCMARADRIAQIRDLANLHLVEVSKPPTAAMRQE